MTVEDVRQAKEIQDIAEANEVLVLHQPPDNLDRKTAADDFARAFDDGAVARLDTLLNKTVHRDFGDFVQAFTLASPSLFVVITYDRFRTALPNLLQFFSQADIVTTR
jgi:hypothetical protein